MILVIKHQIKYNINIYIYIYTYLFNSSEIFIYGTYFLRVFYINVQIKFD